MLPLSTSLAGEAGENAVGARGWRRAGVWGSSRKETLFAKVSNGLDEPAVAT